MVTELIKELKENNIAVSLRDGELVLKFDDEKVAGRYIQRVKEKKKEIIEYLSSLGKYQDEVQIKPLPHQSSYALSSSQRRLWVLSQIENGNVAYNMPGAFILEGDVVPEAFEFAFKEIIKRHESLRTVFKEENEVLQVILAPEDISFKIDYTDLSNEKSDIESRVKEEVLAESLKPFDLSECPLLRARLWRISGRKSVLAYTMHHIISDGWSMEIINKELRLWYNSYVSQKPLQIPALQIHYKEYAAWQQDSLRSIDFLKHKVYWLERFKDEIPVLNLPVDFPRPNVKRYNGGEIYKKINSRLTNDLKAFCKQQNATLFMGLMASVNALLYRYSNQSDIVIGTPVAGRDSQQLENQVGMYVNTLALRVEFNGADSFANLIENIKQVTLNAFAHQSYPFDELVDHLQLKRDISRSALFDVMVAFQNTKFAGGDSEKNLSGLQVSAYREHNLITSKFDLTFDFEEAEKEIALRVEFNSDIFKASTVERISGHFIGLLSALVCHPQEPVSRIDFLPTEEKELLLGVNREEVDYPRESNIVSLFEEQVLRNPGHTAVVFGGRELSYAELNAESNRLAHYLREKQGVKPEDRVCVMLERSEQVIVVIIGILKAGGCYVPIDPDYPEERKAYMINDSGSVLVIDEQWLGLYRQEPALYSQENRPAGVDAANLAYVIYTSGSTGQPKGVMVEHRSVVRLVKSPDYVTITDTDRIMGLSSFSFDGSVFDVFGSLLNGAGLVLVEKMSVIDNQAIRAIIASQEISIFFITTALFNVFTDAGLQGMDKLKYVLFGGERVSEQHVEKFRKQLKDVQLVHVYGPTENTTFSLSYKVKDNYSVIPIGRAINGSTAYIMTEGQLLCPIGVEGEICVGGAGVARGYLQSEALTTEKFIANPHKPGERLYRTGDTGRWLEDGSIEFRGRRDDQVKVRGYRIELGEIEHVFERYVGVEKAVVTVQADSSSDKQLVAYITATGEVDSAALTKFLANILPSYALPAHIIQLQEFPLNRNGKIDKRLLPQQIGQSIGKTASEIVGPRDEIEEKLMTIWKNLLGKDSIGITDNLFELGGHSLKVAKLANQVHKDFNVKLNMHDLFHNAVLEDQAALIKQSLQTSFKSIKPAAWQTSYPMSSSQKRLWVLSQIKDGSIAYNMPGVFTLSGNLNVGTFERAFFTLISRHESLRTVFKEDDSGEIRQFIVPAEETGFFVPHVKLVDKENIDAIRTLITNDYTRYFLLDKGPMVHAALYQADIDKWIFTCVMHHIVSDGWSMGILIRELFLLYNTYIRGEANPLEPLRIQYKDYAVWQQKEINSNAFEEERAYWLNQLKGPLPVLLLPTDKVRPAIKSYAGGTVYKEIGGPVFTQLLELGHEQGCTLFMSLLSAVNVLLYRYTGQDDIITGTPVAGRDHVDLEDQIGLYINTLAFRSRLNSHDTYKNIIDQVKKDTINAYKYQSYPFDEIIDQLDIKTDFSRSVLFDVMVVLQEKKVVDISEQKLDDVIVGGYWGGKDSETVSKFDLTFEFDERTDRLGMRVVYNTDIYNHSSIERMSGHFIGLLSALVCHPQEPVSRIDFLPAEEKELLLGVNREEVDYPRESNIVSLFEEQVLRNPGHTAVVFGGRELSYAELNAESNRLAHYLREKQGVKPEDRVCVMLERSEQVIVVIMAILKAGGCYVPIDPDYPEERKAYMINDSGSVLVIDEQWLGLYRQEPALYSQENRPAGVDAANLAYVIYTSGSTGQPKGVMVEHKSVVRLVKSPDYVTITDTDRIMGLSSFSFDGSVFDVFGSLLNGAGLVLVEKMSVIDSQAIRAIIASQEISIFFITTALFNVFTDAGLQGMDKLKYVLFGGERVSEQHVEKFRKQLKDVQLVHVYGPTENTTFSLSYKVKDNYSVIPIGRAINGSTAYIMTEGQLLCPIGVEGEICVGGSGVARGYLQSEALTTEKFIANPHKPGERLYRTGDTGRWLEDGSIEFRGRRDDQVKVRGYRIELGEIEHVIERYVGVEKAVVIARANLYGENELSAYVTGEAGLNMGMLKDYLSGVLPGYMIPSHIQELPSFPLTGNGKIDKKQLPDISGAGDTAGLEYVAPRNAVEEQLVRMWEEILEGTGIGVKDNFFDLGGHSLKATRLLSRIHKYFEVKIGLRELLLRPVLEAQAILIEESKKSVFIPILRAAEDASYPLSSSQRRLWMLSQLEEGSVAYNVPGSYVFEGRVDLEALNHAFFCLLERHEVLRTVFREDDQGEVRQYIIPAAAVGFSVKYEDLTKEEDVWSVVRHRVEKDFVKAFDLTRGPLLRTVLYRAEEGRWVFSCVMHHIISDGWSMGILVKEIELFYNAYLSGAQQVMEPLDLQYKDYAVWQQELLKGGSLQEHRNYWIEKLSGGLPVLELPSDKVRPPVKTYRGLFIHKRISREVCLGLKKLGREKDCTLFMSLLSAVNVLLYRYSGQEDIIVGSPVAGRDHPDTEEQIGFYVNTIALRTNLKGEESYADLLQKTRSVTMESYQHQSYPFDELIGDLSLQRDMSRNPLFDVMVVLQNNEFTALKESYGKMKVSDYTEVEYVNSQFDLVFNFHESGDIINISLGYNTDLYNHSSIERMSGHFIGLLSALVCHPQEPVSRIDFLPAEEKALLLGVNREEVDYPRESNIVSLFEEQVLRNPGHTAVVFGGRELSYAELNAESNRLAHYLREKQGVKPEDRVCVMLERSEQVIVVIMAILKAGGCYVPIDPDYPEERKAYMINDSGSVLVIDEQWLGLYRQEPALYSQENRPAGVDAANLAYVIYTSGSTGQPKGVMVEHKSVVRLVKSPDYVTITDTDRIMGLSSFSFDGSVFDVFGSLLNGAGLVLVEKMSVIDSQAIRAIIASQEISIFFITTALFNVFTDAGLQGMDKLKYVLFGGERVSEQHVEKFRKQLKDVQLVHVYGPTENTTFSLSYKVKDNYSVIPIGRAINGSTAYIMTEGQLLCPIGVEGEICVGGAGVARGYLQSEALTTEKFIANPHKPGERLYRTGDTGRWLEDGSIEFRGRRDDQVKVRGYRIEPGEIEHVIERYVGVEKAVVIARANLYGENELSAYVTGEAGLNMGMLKDYLSGVLPGYMIPSHIQELPSFPLTGNGKIDKKQLPDISGAGDTAGLEYVAPRNAVEEQLVRMWEEILEGTGIGVKDNFFDLGGHSLKATRLLSRIHKYFEVKIGLRELLLRPVLEAQAILIEESKKSVFIPILRAAEDASYPLSSSQRRLWMLSQLEEGSVAYNVPGSYVFEGRVDLEALNHAFFCLLERHEVLRTVFREDDQGEVRQYIIPAAAVGFSVKYEDLTKEEDVWSVVRHRVEKDFVKAFDLTRGPLLRTVLYRAEEGRWVFSCVMHHIISDGWSMGILVKEIELFYNAYLSGAQQVMEPLDLQYKDYAVWQQELLKGGSLQEHRNYWIEKLSGGLPVLELPSDKVRPPVKTYRGLFIHKRISREVCLGLKKLGREKDCTLFMSLLSAVNVLLYRYSGQEDIIVGSPVAGRDHPDTEEQIGFYVNTIALRTNLKGEESYADLLQKTRSVTMESYQHQSYPFDELIGDLSLQRDMSRNPLFDVMVVLQNNEFTALKESYGKMKVSDYTEVEYVNSQFDLVFNFHESGDIINISLGYNTDIYNHSSIERMSGHFIGLLSALVCHPQEPVSRIDFLPAEEKALLLGVNREEVDYPRESNIVSLFEEQVLRNPGHTAVVFGGRELSYAELNAESNRLAHYLREKQGVKPENRVCVMLERSEQVIVVIMAILKAGGCYVPIDPDYPEERKAYMINDSGSVLVIDEQWLGLYRQEPALYSQENRPAGVDAANLAYVIYTSGSTGQPKGVMVEHSNVVRLFITEKPLFDFNDKDVWALFHSYCFDFSVWEMYGALFFGGKLVIVPKIISQDGNAFFDLLRREKITILNQTPSAFYNLAKIAVDNKENALSLRFVIFGGEALSLERLKEWKESYPDIGLVNMYGITETTVHVTYKRITESEIQSNFNSIGRPIPTLYGYVLDKYRQLTPVGVPGELYIGGAGLARGYLNQPELTAKRFIDDPFLPGNRLYCSGDVVTILDNGELQFRGRRDDQVKVRGYRIEPGEIEHVFERYVGVDKAVVIARANLYGENELSAYVTGEAGLNMGMLKNYLSGVLPGYMIPSHIQELPSFPLTGNGKIDKKQLPDISGAGDTAGLEYVAPRNAVEEQLVRMWEEILEGTGIGVKDNFFDLGGHSLKATRLLSRIHKYFEVKIGLRELLLRPVLEAQAILIEESKKSVFIPILRAAEDASYPLSSSQRRLWMLSQLEEGSVAYNVPGSYVFEGRVDLEALNHAFFCLLERHEVLRTVFREDDQGEVRQYIIPAAAVGFSVKYEDLTKEEDVWSVVRHRVEKDFVKAFDLTRGPLLRTVLYRAEEGRWVFSCVMHHIISDGWSMGILVKEIELFYNAYLSGAQQVMEPLDLQYKDYAVWQQELLKGGSLQEHRNYWIEKLSGGLPVLELPSDKVRPPVKTYRGLFIHKRISREVCLGLKKLGREKDCTLFMSLLSAVNVLLYRYSGQEDIIVGSPVAGRDHPDTEEQIGFYVNTIALRTNLKGEESYADLLQKTRSVTMESYQHQSYPFDELIGDLSLQRDMSRNPLFDVMVVLQNNEFTALKESYGKMKVSDYTEVEYVNSQFDLVFNFHESGDIINISLGYNTDLYNHSSIERMSGHFIGLLSALVCHPQEPVSRIDFLPAEEKELLLGVNREEVDYPRESNIVSLFEEQVLRNPGHTAVVFGGRELSYAELNAESNRLAHYLHEKQGVKPEDRVCVMLERSEQVIVVIMAILKAGGCYVPIDPDYPEERKAYMINDSGSVLVIDEQWLGLYRQEPGLYSQENRPAGVGAANLAYVIYTSGSTGQPKGVMVEHRGVVNRLNWMWHAYDFDSTDIILQKTTFTFDVSVWEFFMPLCWGCKLVLCSAEDSMSPEQIVTLIHRHKISCIHFVPSMLNAFMGSVFNETGIEELLGSLRHVITSGEVLSAESVGMWYEKLKTPIQNLYGPTEASVDVTAYTTHPGDQRIPIGRPIWNTQIYILGNENQLQAIGIAGEICIAGDGLARGYLNREELTRERFVENPLHPGSRMYRTGDLGRWLADGNVEYLGRKDDQVKIRGYRIEPGEIEHALQAITGINGAVVIARSGQKGEKELVAYVTADGEIDLKELRRKLTTQLPLYMVPGHYMILDRIPLTGNGKVDRKSLPSPEHLELNSGSEYVAPRTEAERMLVAVMEEVLQQKKIGIKSDFFMLGGDSIKAIQAVSRLKQRGFRVSVKQVLLHPELEEMSQYINKGPLRSGTDVVVGEVKLGAIQRRFFDMGGELDHYNQSVMLECRERLDREAVVQILTKMLEHHDGLRMVYKLGEDGDWKQYVKEIAAIEVDLGETEGLNSELYDLTCDRLQAGMRLDSGPLLKAALFHEEDKDLLLLVAHHLVIDGVSWRILLEDLNILYSLYKSGEILQLPEKTDSYQYWQNRLGELAEAGKMEEENAYWRALEDSDAEFIPKDNPKGSNKVKDLEVVGMRLNRAETERLQMKCYRAFRTNMNDILVNCLGEALLEKWGLRRVLINMEGQGREELPGMSGADVSRTVGWFTTIYPVLSDMDNQQDRLDRLIHTKELLHRVPNKGFGYGLMTNHPGFGKRREGEIIFNYLGDFGNVSGVGIDEGLEQPLFIYSSRNRGSEISEERENESVLTVTGITAGGEFHLTISYSREQFNQSTMDGLLNLYEKHLRVLLECLPEERGCLTPVDLTYKGLSIPALTELGRAGEVEDVYELSPMQEGLYYHWLSAPESSVYFEQMGYRLAGDLIIDLVEKSYQKLISRHNVLRTHFVHKYTDRPVQVVKKRVKGDFTYEDVRGSKDFSLSGYKEIDRLRGFDLHRGSQIRLTVLQVAEEEYEFIWSHHHILMDGWCVGILLREFFQVYNGLQTGTDPNLSVIYPYSQYLTWLNGVDSKGTLGYWKSYLSDYNELSCLPKRQARIAPQKKKKCFSLELSDSLREGIGKLSQRSGVTENTFMQTIWGILLGKYNNTEDVVYGSVVSGRPGDIPGIEEMIGLFINTIPVRVKSEEGMSVEQLLKRIQQQSASGSEHHYIQLAEIQGVSELGRELFDHIMIFENYPVVDNLSMHIQEKGSGETSLTVLSTEVFEETNYDFALIVIPGKSRWRINFEYNSTVYLEAQVERIARHLQQIIIQVLNNPGLKVRDLEYFTNEEKALLLGVNREEVDYPRESNIVSLFEEQVLRNPGHTAVVFGGRELSYAELNAESNRLAHYLREKQGVKPEDRVCVMLERSEQVIVVIMAILKAGGCYVPIDPDYPEERKAYMINDSGSVLVIDEQWLGLYRQEPALYSQENRPAGVGAANLAYVIYTSGSTGQPKGVMVEHKSVVRLVKSPDYVTITDTDRIMGLSSFSFDGSVFDVFGSLLNGAGLVLVEKMSVIDSQAIRAIIASQEISMFFITTALFNVFTDAGLQGMDKLKYVLFGGERVSEQHVEKFRKQLKDVQLVHVYGPTENTTFSLSYKVKDNYSVIPIGRAINGSTAYIMTEGQLLCPIGVEGEICVGGAGVARGYLQSEALTKEKFIANPHKPGERLYRTGDTGRWLEDGSIEFRGRRDDQVKVRGYRIELGEIAAILHQHPQISSCVVNASNLTDHELVAYVVSKDKRPVVNIKTYLAQKLPSFMIPQKIIWLDTIPLTANGKADIRELNSLYAGSSNSTKEKVLPDNEMEEILIKIWHELLGEKDISVTDNFFDIGGNSIKIIKLTTLIKNSLGVDLSVTSLFQYPTIRELVAFIRKELPAYEEEYINREEILNDLSKFNID